MRVLLLRANPRKTGYTQRLTDLFLAGLQQGAAQVEDVDLTARRIEPCLGCYSCWTTTPGECVHRDDMQELRDQFLAADVIVCATPLYYYAMSSYLKCFWERTMPLTRHGLEKTAAGLMRNNIRYPDRWDKTLITIVVGALQGGEVFDAARETFRLIADGLDMKLGGQLIRPESYLIQFSLAKPLAVRTIEAAFERAGREVAATGEVSAATSEKAATPLAPDEVRFREYSNVYWENAIALGGEAGNLDKVSERVGTDVRIMMREMERSVDLQAIARVKAVIQFDFPDRDLYYRITLNCGVCEMRQEHTEQPDLRITCAGEVWGKVLVGRIDVMAALKKGDIQLEGDKSLFLRLGRYFPPPSS